MNDRELHPVAIVVFLSFMLAVAVIGARLGAWVALGAAAFLVFLIGLAARA